MTPTSQSPKSLSARGISPHIGAVNQDMKRTSCKAVLTLAYQSLGVVYGDLSTSPLYVYKSTFSGKLSLQENDEEIFGVLSFIFWTFTIIPLFKYIFIVLSADDNGEGGTFALYSLLCRHARLCILPNQQSADEKLSTYGKEGAADTWQSSMLKSFFDKHPKFRNGLLTIVLLGTCMTIGDGVLTPTISVLSAVSGVKVKITELHENYIVVISCVILVGLFSLQHHGTHRVAFLFAPIVTAWLLCISSIGIYNILRWNPSIFCALSPYYMFRFLRSTGTEGWVSLGGVVLCITEAVFWPVFVVATLASVVGSQAVISATFSMVSQCCALSCFPRVKIVHTSSQIYGQIYIPEVNWILMCLCLAVTIGLRDTNMIGHAYGLAVTTVMFVTTCLMSLVIIIVWKRKITLAIAFLVFFGSIELLYISASLVKVPEGGWIPLVLSLIFMGIMYVWNYGTLKKHEFDMENKVSVKRILASGPSLGMVRVPGIGLIYTDLVTGVPAVFGHFVTNLPAFHQVLVFVCVKSVQVPYVRERERLLVGRIGSKEYAIFRCIVRYGYKDLQQEDYNFENRLVAGILEFVQMEGDQPMSRSNSERSCEVEISDDEEDHDRTVPMLPYPNDEENVQSSSDIQVVKSEIGIVEDSHHSKESLEIMKARESGVAYILGHSYAKAKKSSSLLKKFAINIIYDFLSKNCRGPDVVLNVPHTSMLEVGMVYYV
ncbi:potassium transporter 1 isoform X3 [Magnolia sinica]|uniref:potassium transporter 1 isoform X3 n=1 Tax=Magnolia sinica TaxID=86752 RepID=UPI002658F0D1|nr:potassium transporter 1 isoform X3 [Magnolia sinica]